MSVKKSRPQCPTKHINISPKCLPMNCIFILEIQYSGKFIRILAIVLTVIVWIALFATMALSIYSFFYTDVFFQDMLVPFTGEESYALVIEGKGIIYFWSRFDNC